MLADSQVATRPSSEESGAGQKVPFGEARVDPFKTFPLRLTAR